MLFARNGGMECYFGSYPRRNATSEDKNLVCFSIPAAGIVFKAPFGAAERLHSEYASLLTLLEFIELNGKLFKDQELKIFGDNLELINQVNKKAPCRYEYSELLKKALDYKKKYNFRLGWVSKDRNPSTDSLFD